MNGSEDDGFRELTEGSDLFYVHLDERERSVTLGFARERGSEGSEFFLRFPEARDVRVRGWTHPGRKDVRVTRGDPGDGVAVDVSSQGSSLSFRAAGITVARTRSFPVWPGA
ncbi:hypothetical protein [Streptomyces xanthii]|uniref:Uncharacterized protein n=1 Tax=Streptomyces xanthii TaxID=2768069 RepID=A0A7H1B5Z0_9ACTN|nr:hypothetical protein [Streptomyces xanthii]QNS04145.1 hypothetical protein IAG42_11260 [Streptomyces xanthii]